MITPSTGYSDSDNIYVRAFKDGDKWCAIYPDTFENLGESDAGFGDTPQEAINNLFELLK